MDLASFATGLGIGALLGAAASWLARRAPDADASARDAALATEARRDAATDAMLGPIRTLLGRIESGIHDLDRERVRSEASVGERLQLLLDNERRLQEETARLARALASPTTKGQWGEMQLRRVVELAGMVPHVDFDLQPVVSGGDGAVSRPDMVIHLPEGRDVYVDAKTPLHAFLEAASQVSDAARATHLRDHARQVRAHVDVLAARRYERLAGGPELVVMFLPGEPLLAAALEHDGGLLEHAIGKGVMLASPTSLVALLRAIAFGWERRREAEGAAAIAGAGRELADRVQILAGHLEELRRGLGGALQAYNRAVGSFESRVLPSVRRLHELGAAAEPIPPGILEVAPRSGADGRLIAGDEGARGAGGRAGGGA